MHDAGSTSECSRSELNRSGCGIKSKLHIETDAADPSRVAVREVPRSERRTDERVGAVHDRGIKHRRPQADVAGDRQLAAGTHDPAPAPIVEAELISGNVEIGRERVSRSNAAGDIKQHAVHHDAGAGTGRDESIESAGY